MSAHPAMGPGDYIDGRFTLAEAADGELHIACPGDLDRKLAIHPHTRAHVDRAIEAARRALPGWRRTPRSEREALLRRYQAALGEHREAIAECIALEVGKPRWEAVAEVSAMVAKVDVMRGEGARFTEDRLVDDLPGEVRHRPLGVLAVLGPFNFPGHLPNGQIVPALLMGNTVVHKPSEKTPGAAVWIARCIEAAGFPPGVFNVVQGEGAAGQALSTHPDIDGVLFTGSAAVGQAIVRDNAWRPHCLVALELGGKNAAIVLEDCDLEATARAIAFAAFATAGQRCTSTSFVIAAPAVEAALSERLCALAAGIRVGHPLHEATFMGPLVSEAALRRVQAAQAQATAAGFERLTGGDPVRVEGHRGHYLRPAIHRAGPGIDTATLPDYSRQELFAPDLALYRADGADPLERAIELANDTPYGLVASVFTASRQAFERCADALRVGLLHWNRSSAGASGRLPFGGVKQSGNHRPAGVMAAAACSHPLAILAPAQGAGGRWPGFPDP
ncbi:MAG: aldehyde dehydrogenase family protein [Myxococcales bacterium]|nr:aldehyde dehydrogenase family protein [Myxococcales bacterium]